MCSNQSKIRWWYRASWQSCRSFIKPNCSAHMRFFLHGMRTVCKWLPALATSKSWILNLSALADIAKRLADTLYSHHRALKLCFSNIHPFPNLFHWDVFSYLSSITFSRLPGSHSSNTFSSTMGPILYPHPVLTLKRPLIRTYLESSSMSLVIGARHWPL